MRYRTTVLPILIAVAVWAAPAVAQPAINWFSIDCGGETSTGGGLTLSGTIGQPDAAPPSTSGVLFLTGGYRTVNTCPQDFNGDGALTVSDIFDFLAAWFASDPRANFDGIGGTTVADIFAFLSAWFAGCP